MSTEATRDVIRRYTSRVDAEPVSAIDEFMAPNFLAHLPATPGPLDREGFKQFATIFYTAFPDLRHEIEDLLVEDDRVTGRFTLRGTHRAEFQGIPPTDRQVVFGAIAVCRVAEGKIVEIWMQLDGVGLLGQLGAFPPPAREAA
jgi:predicted ester cyclase